LTELLGRSTTEQFLAQLTAFGINPSKVHRNLPTDEMVAISVDRKEGVVNSTGSLSVDTGKYTGRSPDDRFIVYDDKTHDTIDWGMILLIGEKLTINSQVVNLKNFLKR